MFHISNAFFRGNDEHCLFRWKELRKTLRRKSNEPEPLDEKKAEKHGQMLSNLKLKIMDLEKDMVARNISFEGGYIFRQFHLTHSTGYPKIDHNISSYITNYVRNSPNQNIPDGFEIHDQIEKYCLDLDIKTSEQEINNMCDKVRVDMIKEYKNRQTKQSLSNLELYLDEDQKAEFDKLEEDKELQEKLSKKHENDGHLMDRLADELVTGKIGMASQKVTDLNIKYFGHEVEGKDDANVDDLTDSDGSDDSETET